MEYLRDSYKKEYIAGGTFHKHGISTQSVPFHTFGEIKGSGT
jgi:hypothetical protein